MKKAEILEGFLSSLKETAKQEIVKTMQDNNLTDIVLIRDSEGNAAGEDDFDNNDINLYDYDCVGYSGFMGEYYNTYLYKVQLFGKNDVNISITTIEDLDEAEGIVGDVILDAILLTKVLRLVETAIEKMKANGKL